MCVNYYSYLTTNQADVQPGWAKKDRFDSSNTTLSKIKNHVVIKTTCKFLWRN